MARRFFIFWITNFIASNYHRFAENLIIIRATHFMSLRGIANGDAVAISRKGNLVIKPKTINAILSAFTNFRTWSTPLFINTSLLKSNKRELIKISIQFVCKLQSIIILYTKVNRSLFPYHMHLYLYLLKHTYYIW